MPAIKFLCCAAMPRGAVIGGLTLCCVQSIAYGIVGYGESFTVLMGKSAVFGCVGGALIAAAVTRRCDGMRDLGAIIGTAYGLVPCGIYLTGPSPGLFADEIALGLIAVLTVGRVVGTLLGKGYCYLCDLGAPAAVHTK